MAESDWIVDDQDGANGCKLCGDWRLPSAASLEAALGKTDGRPQHVDGTGIEALDAAGAFVLLRWAARSDLNPDQIGLRAEHRQLLDTVRRSLEMEEPPDSPGQPLWRLALGGLGRLVVALKINTGRLLGFLGLVLVTLVKTAFRPAQWRVTATVHHMQQSGLAALPLVSLLSFLVGAVVAFLGATVLRDFGAELFVVDLTTYAFLREFGVLLTAILLAGRTASAFTAQIGTMKSREEIDAIRTLGQDPIILLVLPRLLALLIMLPLLAVVATLAGLLGGLAVSVFSLGIPLDLYISRVQETASLSHYLTGLVKAPVFALIIALVGCLEGFKVAGTAQSVGERTTSAVVQSISLVIIIDALAAVFFMEMGW